MLEVAILDNTEQLIGKIQPTALPSVSSVAFQINGLVTGLVYSGDSTIASSLAQTLAKMGIPINTYPAPDFSKYWIGASAGIFPANKCVLFDAVTETATLDDSGGRGLVQIIVESGGTVWAQATVAPYGLYKRTAAGTWAQVIADSGGLGTMRYRYSDNTYWWTSFTNNNYQLTSTASSMAAPSGTLVVAGSFYGWRNLDAPYLSAAGAFGAASTFLNADGTAYSTPPKLPNDAYINYGGPSLSAVQQLHLDSTYSLFVTYSATGGTNLIYYLYLWNKTTNVIKYIGCLPPLSVKGTVTPTSAHLSPFAAKWQGAGLRLYFAGSVLTCLNDATAGNLGGIIRVDIPYQPNF